MSLDEVAAILAHDDAFNARFLEARGGREAAELLMRRCDELLGERLTYPEYSRLCDKVIALLKQGEN